MPASVYIIIIIIIIIINNIIIIIIIVVWQKDCDNASYVGTIQKRNVYILMYTIKQARSQTPPIGGRLKFQGAIVTGHRTQLTIAITDSATSMKMRLQNNAANEASRKKLVCTLSCDILGVHQSQMKSKNCSNEFVWGQDGSREAPSAPSWLRNCVKAQNVGVNDPGLNLALLRNIDDMEVHCLYVVVKNTVQSGRKT